MKLKRIFILFFVIGMFYATFISKIMAQDSPILHDISFENGIFTIIGENLVKEDVRVIVTEDWERKTEIEDTLKNLSFSETMATYSLSFPYSEEKIAYKIFFNLDATDRMKLKNSIDVNIGADEETENTKVKEIIKLKNNNPDIPSSGGEGKITLMGTGIDDVVAKVFKIENGIEVLDDSIVVNKNIVEGEVKFLTINFPATDEISTYRVKVGFEENSMDKFTDFVVGQRSSAKLVEVLPRVTYLNSEKNLITLVFDEKIQAVIDNLAIKDGISIKVGNSEFSKLTEDDRVELVVPNKITISLGKALPDNTYIYLKFNERIIKRIEDGEEFDLKEFTTLVSSNIPIILDANFVSSDVLGSEGGLVSFKVSGENLNIKNFFDEPLLKFEAKKMVNNSNESVEAEVDYISSKEAVVRVRLEENIDTKPVSYLIRVSRDAGNRYSSEIEDDTIHRFKKLVATVLPKNYSGEPLISYISIQSYGTTENKDQSYTELPVNYQSKKTDIRVYGVNLKKELTKLKIVDVNDVSWYPINNKNSSGAFDNFATVAFDGTGILGSGNFQVIELICPKNISNNPEFKIYIAPDGKNYDYSNYVRATVLDDGTANKNELRPVNLKISYKTENGDDIIKEDNIKAYSFTNFISFGIEEVSIDGYNLKGFKLIDEEGNSSELFDIDRLYSYESKIANNKELSFIYEKNVVEAIIPIDMVDGEKTDSEKLLNTEKKEYILSKKVNFNKYEKHILANIEDSSIEDTATKILILRANSKKMFPVSFSLSKAFLDKVLESSIDRIRFNTKLFDVGMSVDRKKFKKKPNGLMLSLQRDEDGIYMIHLIDLKKDRAIDLDKELSISIKSTEKKDVYIIEDGKRKKTNSTYDEIKNVIRFKTYVNTEFVLE